MSEPEEKIADKPKLTKAEIVDLVDRGLVLARQVRSLSAKSKALDEIKARLREQACEKDVEFSGSRGAVARVEQKPAGVARSVDESLVKRVLALAGDKLASLFSLHPAKGNEQTFELNAFKNLPRKTAIRVLEELTVPATAWVRFAQE